MKRLSSVNVSHMRKLLLMAATAAAISAAAPSFAQTSNGQAGAFPIKTRADHLSGTPMVLVVSNLPDEITSVTCKQWVMLGIGSWKHHNDFTIPSGLTASILDARGFDGYCLGARDIVAHTDSGDYWGVLDRGAGNWRDSTKLTFNAKNRLDQ
jgi:hypothetical protein